jgi:hypothetical protein
MSEDKNKRYRVKIVNAKECHTTISFPDLCVKFSNGFSEPLKLQEGEEIPFEVLDPEDVRKSWIVGSLKKYLAGSWLEEIKEEPQSKPLTKSDIAQIKAATPIQGTGEIPLISIPPNVSDKAEDKKQEVQPNLPKEEAPTTLSNFSLVKTYEDFSKLSYFLKLRFIKESNDIPLLKEILEKTESHQFKNNIAIRLAK